MKKTIVLVDEIISTRGLMKDYLVQAGYHVATAVSGKQALAGAPRVDPNLLILDVIFRI